MDVPAASGGPQEMIARAVSPAGTNPLTFSMQSQLQTEWCWAATAASVSAFYKDVPTLSQCQIASDCLSVPCCITPLPPPPPPDWEGNRWYTLDVALSVAGHRAGPPIQGPLDFPAIVAEIDAGRPVCCHILWDQDSPGDGHFNAIIGYDGVNRDVVVRDPSTTYGDGTFPYETFKSNYYGGKWDGTYLTR
jgi:hypothetical protein